MSDIPVQTALLLGGPADGLVFPLPEQHGHTIMIQEDFEIGDVTSLIKDADIPLRRHRYVQCKPALIPGSPTRFVVFFHKGLDAV